MIKKRKKRSQNKNKNLKVKLTKLKIINRKSKNKKLWYLKENQHKNRKIGKVPKKKSLLLPKIIDDDYSNFTIN